MDAIKICSQISEGKISEVKEQIITYNGEVFDSKFALPILITLCKTVSQIDTNSINDIFDLANICCKNITRLKENERDNFLLSLYHVIKYLFKYQLHSKVLVLMKFIKQHCIDKKFKSDIYQYYLALFHASLQNVKNTGDMLLSMVSYCFQFQIFSKKYDFSSFIINLKWYASFFRINTTHSSIFCSKIYTLLENVPPTENQNDVKEIYAVLLSILIITIENLPNCQDDIVPHFVQDHIEQTFVIMRKHCKNKEYTDCIEILESLTQSVIKNIKHRSETDLEILIDFGKKLKAIIRKRSTNPIVINTCCHISTIFRFLSEYLQHCKDLWNEYFPMPMQVEILRTIEVLGQFISKTSLNIDKCCGDCKFQTNIYRATVITSCAGILTLTALRLNMTCSDEFYALSHRCIKMCCNFINKLKEEGCNKYVYTWRTMGAAIYNAAVILYKNKDYKFSLLSIHLFVTNVIRLEGIDDPDLCFPNSLGASLHLLAVDSSFLNKNKETMLYLSLTMLLSPEFKRKALQTWIMLKSNDEDLKPLTVHHFLFNEQDAIKKIYPSYIYNQKDCEGLLMDELQYYFENWPSKTTLRSVCNEFCTISKNPIYRTRCFVMSWEKVIPLRDSNFIKNLEETIDMIAETTDVNFKMCLSILYYIQYQYKMNEIIIKNMADMNEVYIPLKSSPLQPYEEPPNPNDKCDIVPAFYNMKIDNLLKIYKIMDNCLEIWDLLLSDDKYELDANVVSSLNLGHFIKLTAYEYRMQYFNIKMCKAWILYYKFAKLFQNKHAIVTSIGFIIENCESGSESVKALEKEAENLLVDFDKNDPVELEIYLTYYINKSSGHYKNDLVEMGYSTLRKAEIILEEANVATLEVCKARILHLKTCYLLLPCANNILNHDDNFMLTSQNSFAILAEYYTKQSTKCPYLVSILFEISLVNGWMYKWLRLPREARCYTKESILLAQKCVLPIRTAQFLSLLAFVDLLDLQYADCEVKLNGLTKMLCYASHITYEKLTSKTQITEDIKLESSVSESFEMDNSNSIIQTVLDVPTSQTAFNTVLMGSPQMRRKTFVFPEFVKHPVDCNCFMCSNCEYQKLILDAIHLEALLNLYQGINIEEDYFKGGLLLYEKLFSKSKLLSYKSLKLSQNEEICIIVYTNISQNYCKFLLDYSYFLVHRNALFEAKKVVDNIFKLLSNVKHVNIYLWCELKLQKFNLFIEQEITEENSFNSENYLQVPDNVLQPKTPPNKISQTNIHLSVSPVETTIPQKTFKKLTFDLSDDENDEKLLTPERNKSFFFKFQTPAKTPAPAAPKTKIYTPKTVKSKRTLPKGIMVPLTATPSNSGVKKSVNKVLEERTRLLTEKLKAEIKPLPADVINKQLIKEPPKTEVTAVKPGVRKKLLDEMDDIEEVDKLTINTKKEETEKLKQVQCLKKATTVAKAAEKLQVEKKPLLKDTLNEQLNKEPPKTEVTEVKPGIRKKLLDEMDDIMEEVDKVPINTKNEETEKLKQVPGLKKATAAAKATEKLKVDKKPLLKGMINEQLNKDSPKTEVKPGIRKKLLDEMDDIIEEVDKLTINTKNEETEKLKQVPGLKKATAAAKAAEVKPKKYRRIKPVSSSSSSDSSSDNSGIRKSARIKKSEK